jgi:protein TonB
MPNRSFAAADIADFHLKVPFSETPAGSAAPSRYGERKQANWAVIAAIASAHAGAFAALVMLDIVALPEQHADLTMVTLMPLPITSQPQPRSPSPPLPSTKVPREVVSPIVTPTPIVAAPAPVVAVAVSAKAAEPAAVTVAAPPVEQGPPVAADPITPPDASAATLGNPSPRYPAEARRKRQEGVVRLRVVITLEGRVKEISVARSSGFESLDEAALETVRKWRFRPGQQGGKPVEAVGVVPIAFKTRD